jgi:hypothetical protein
LAIFQCLNSKPRNDLKTYLKIGLKTLYISW